MYADPRVIPFHRATPSDQQNIPLRSVSGLRRNGSRQLSKRKREDTKSSHPTTPAKPTTTESASTRPPNNNTKTKTRKKTSLLHKHHHQKGLLPDENRQTENKETTHRQKSKRRHVARIRKAVGDKIKVKEPERANKRRRLLTLQATKKLEEQTRTKLAHELRRWQKPRSTPDLEEEEPTFRTTKRHRNRGQRAFF